MTLRIERPNGTSWPSSHPAVLLSFLTVTSKDLGAGPVARTAMDGLATDRSVARLRRRALPDRRRRRHPARQERGRRVRRRPPIDSARARLDRLARPRSHPPVRRLRHQPPRHRDRAGVPVRRLDPAARGSQARRERRAHQHDGVLGADRHDHRGAPVLRDRSLLRVRRRGRHAGAVERGAHAARRDRRRGPDQHPVVPQVPLLVLPGDGRRGDRAGVRHRLRSDRRPHHRRPPRQADQLAAGVPVRGRQALRVHLRGRHVPGHAGRRPGPHDHAPGGHAHVARRARSWARVSACTRPRCTTCSSRPACS